MPARFAPDTPVLSRMIRATILAGIRCYQLFFSQLFTGSCRFLPSCSCYAAEAVERHGAVKGGVLAVRRLARCHPLCQGGHDPVPLS